MPNHRRLHDEQQRQIGERYANGECVRAIAANYPEASEATIRRAILKQGMTLRRRMDYDLQPANGKLTPERKRELVAGYRDGESSLSLARRFGVTKIAVLQILRRRGVPRRTISEACRRHALNESAFDQITEESAYWLGFLMADGGVCPEERPGHGSAPRIVLQLQGRDSAHVHAFRTFMGSEHKITEKPPRGKAGPQTYFAFTSAHVASVLASFGIVPRKSKIACLLSSELEHNVHFWRGVIDGDGTVSILNIGGYLRSHIGLVGSRPLLEQFSSFVRRIVPSCPATVRPGKYCWQCRLTGRAANAVIQALYNRPVVVLARKYLSAQAALSRHHISI